MSVNDTPDVYLDRLLTDWLEADAAPRAPESLETAFVEGVARTRQRPAWATTERWISMETRAQLGVMPRALILLLTIALLAIGAVGGYAVGSGIVDAADGGRDPLAGLTYGTPEGVIYMIDEAGEPVRLSGEDERASNPAWSPDGTRFSYESWNDQDGLVTITIRDADDSNPIAVSEPFEPTSGSVALPYHAWSPDGSTVLYWAPGVDLVDEDEPCRTGPGTFCGERIWSVPTDGSQMAQVIGDPALHARSPVWTPDGESIIFAGVAGGETGYGIYRMDADGTNVERVGDLTGSAYSFDVPSISPDGTTLVVASGQGPYDIYLVDLATGEETLIAGEAADEFEPIWSPDGSLIVFTNAGEGFGVEFQAMLYDVASGEVRSLGAPLWAHGWSPDSRFIVSEDGGVMTVVDVTDTTAPVLTMPEGVTDAFSPSWQPLP